MRPLLFLLASGAALIFAASSSSAADDISKVTVESSSFQTAEVVSQASSGGTSVLGQIEVARAAIAGGDFAKAGKDLTQAQAQLAELRKLNPAAPVQDAIRSVEAKLDAGDTDGAVSDLQEISSSVTVVDDYDKAVAHVKVETDKPMRVSPSVGKQHIAAALGHAKVKDIEKAKVELRAAYETAVYTEVDLPVAASYYEVTHALEAVQDGAKHTGDPGYAKIADNQLAAAAASAQTIVDVAKSSASDVDVAAEPN